MIKFASVNLARTATRMKHILIVDNYDSFTYNLVHYVEAEGFHVSVARNDVLDLTSLDRYDKSFYHRVLDCPKMLVSS